MATEQMTVSVKLWRDIEQGLLRANSRVRELEAILDGFRRIGFKPCKDPACYRPTLEMMQRADAALSDDEVSAAIEEQRK